MSARAIDSVENNRAATWLNGKRAIVLAIQRQPGSNTIQIVDEINRIIPHFTQTPAQLGEARPPSMTAASRSAPRWPTCRSRC